MTISISNDSPSVFAHGYTHTEKSLIVWLEVATQHLKLTGAIWAFLVSSHHPYLQFKDGDKDMGMVVYGLGSAYTCLEVDASTLSVASDGGKTKATRAELSRLVAPEAIKPVSLDQLFYVLTWPGWTPETVLVVTLDKVAPYPVRFSEPPYIEWGQYLLETALDSAMPSR